MSLIHFYSQFLCQGLNNVPKIIIQCCLYRKWRNKWINEPWLSCFLVLWILGLLRGPSMRMIRAQESRNHLFPLFFIPPLDNDFLCVGCVNMSVFTLVLSLFIEISVKRHKCLWNIHLKKKKKWIFPNMRRPSILWYKHPFLALSQGKYKLRSWGQSTSGSQGCQSWGPSTDPSSLICHSASMCLMKTTSPLLHA